jgi:hypothetical protein
MNTHALEDEIAALAVQLTAATYRLLELIRRFDESEVWAGYGFRSCAHWLSWRIGLDLGAAREKLRVAKALVDLPLISASFEKGEVSFSKVRAMTRVAQPKNEKHLLNIALNGTASHVERFVRLYRRSSQVGLTQAQRQDQNRTLDTFWDDDGMLVVRGRLTPEAGAAFLKALRTCEDTSAPHAGGRRADALRRLSEKALAVADDARDAYQVVVHVDAPVLADPSADLGRSEIEDGPGVSAETSRRLACDGSKLEMHHAPDGSVLDLGRKTRVISTPLRRALKERDHGCRYPGCANTRFVDGHHIQHWADGGETKLDNLVLLCSYHHQKVHEGGFQMERTNEGLSFKSPHGWTVPCLPPKPTEPAAPLPPPTCEMPTWAGDQMDYDFALQFTP